jgi:hypothetical protein
MTGAWWEPLSEKLCRAGMSVFLPDLCTMQRLRMLRRRF